MRYDLTLDPQTRLERHCAKWLRSEARDRDGSIASVMRDLSYGGCASGMVGHLIYTRDILNHFRAHRAEIESTMRDYAADTGCDLRDLMGDAYSATEDPFMQDDQSRTWLAWAAFEHTCHSLAYRAGWNS